MNEVKRIENYLSGEKPSGVTVTMSLSTSEPKGTLGKIISILMVTITALKKDLWPDDVWWREHLPKWFVESFDHSLEEIMKDEYLWDFGSWIDAIKFRGWEWWSSKTSDESLKIYLEAYDDPYVIEAFEYAVRVSGGKDIEITEG